MALPQTQQQQQQSHQGDHTWVKKVMSRSMEGLKAGGSQLANPMDAIKAPPIVRAMASGIGGLFGTKKDEGAKGAKGAGGAGPLRPGVGEAPEASVGIDEY